jgi:hypothetical protein
VAGGDAFRDRGILRGASPCLFSGSERKATMTVETPRVASLRKKLKARESRSEYKKNCEEIRKEIARLTDCQDLDL